MRIERRDKMRNSEDTDLSELGGRLNVPRGGERLTLGFCYWQLTNDGII